LVNSSLCSFESEKNLFLEFAKSGGQNENKGIKTAIRVHMTTKNQSRLLSEELVTLYAE
jgi:hypothetical protein